MITGFLNGNPIEWTVNGWVYLDTRQLAKTPNPCPKCGELPTKKGHDHCLANLPGVKNACCGHGVEEGYIQFKNGITIRGFFKIGIINSK
jgi:hypothetical protein